MSNTSHTCRRRHDRRVAFAIVLAVVTLFAVVTAALLLLKDLRRPRHNKGATLVAEAERWLRGSTRPSGGRKAARRLISRLDPQARAGWETDLDRNRGRTAGRPAGG